MYTEDQESIQLLNTAIIKSKEKKIDSSYDERLSGLCSSPALKALSYAVNLLSESENISRDRAATMVVETIRELDNVWTDYVMMEGIEKLKELLNTNNSN